MIKKKNKNLRAQGTLRGSLGTRHRVGAEMQNEWIMGMMPQVLYYLHTFAVTRRIRRVRGFSFTKGGAKMVLFYFSISTWEGVC